MIQASPYCNKGFIVELVLMEDCGPLKRWVSITILAIEEVSLTEIVSPKKFILSPFSFSCFSDKLLCPIMHSWHRTRAMSRNLQIVNWNKFLFFIDLSLQVFYNPGRLINIPYLSKSFEYWCTFSELLSSTYQENSKSEMVFSYNITYNCT